MNKRVSCRGLVITDNKLVVMYREKNGRVYYAFPGGGKNDDESETECVTRELFEEFGINVQPVKKVYIYEDETTIQHFYVCAWVSGKLGTGVGEEFQPDRNKGVYVPMQIKMTDIPEIPLMPPSVAKQLYKDAMLNGEGLRNDICHIS